MTYEVLARRLRPRHFGELIGQEHVVRVLSHALKHGRLHHAYLFTGTRGVGKTTIARILAKCMNCEACVTDEPCLKCGNCVEIGEGRFPDLVEVDAASRTRVDQTRELLENIPYAPVRGRYKVYLIDEVHMLSQASFNALLKTLEEPPDHVRFLLATTDAKKVPVTVLSRCLQLQLKNLLPDRIGPYLEEVLSSDAVEFDTEAVAALARAGRGSMRDALSLTDQAIAFCGGALKNAQVSNMLGTLHRENLQRLIDALVAQDAVAAIQLVSELAELGVDFAAALDQLSLAFHNAAVSQALGDAAAQTQRLAAWDPASLQVAYQIVIEAARDLPLAPDPRCGFEMAVLRILAFRPMQVSDISMTQDESSGSQSPALEPSGASATAGAEPDEPQIDARATLDEAQVDVRVGDTQSSAALDWNAIVDELKEDPLVKQLARNTWLIDYSGDILRLGVDEKYAPSVQAEHVSGLCDSLREQLGVNLRLELDRQADPRETPAQRDARITSMQHASAKKSISSDTFVRFLISEFNAKIDDKSIQPLSASSS